MWEWLVIRRSDSYCLIDYGRRRKGKGAATFPCNDLKEAEKWRQQVIRQVSEKVSQIQNPGFGEYRFRDLNNEINKLLREKDYWQDRIMKLGGPDYYKIGPKMIDHEGEEVPGNCGYKYFPGVRELFEKEPSLQGTFENWLIMLMLIIMVTVMIMMAY